MKARERLLHERACVSVERMTDGGWNTKESEIRGGEDRQLNIKLGVAPSVRSRLAVEPESGFRPGATPVDSVPDHHRLHRLPTMEVPAMRCSCLLRRCRSVQSDSDQMQTADM